MTRGRLYGARLAALSAVFGGALYLFWRGGQLSQLDAPAYVFFGAEVVNYLALVAAVVLFWSPYRRLPPPSPPDTVFDVVIPVCGEDVGMVEATLRAALAIEHPHATTVLNDGRIADCDNWREIELLCSEYGVRCLTRTEGPRGKAGNLNAALSETFGDIIVVLDADHLARPELGEMLLGYFNDPSVALVTTRQCFKLDRDDLLGHQESLFYSSIQPAKDRDNAAFSCGNGVAYRRAAIEDLGGFSEWNLVEDLHTTYLLHARGWRSAYLGVPVSVGTAPATAAEMANQRLRWATDSLRIFFWDNPLLKRGLTWRQRLHYLHTTGWYLVAAAHLVFLISPIVSILLGARLLVAGTEGTYALLLALYLIPVAATLIVHVGWRAALRTAQMQTFLAPVFALAVPRALLMSPRRRRRERGVRGAVTQKSRQRRLSWFTSFQHVMLALLLVSIGVSIARPGAASWAVVMWACVLAAALATPGSMLGLRRDVSQSLRIAVAAPAIGAAVLVALSLLPANAVDARDSTRALTQQAAQLSAQQSTPAQQAAANAVAGAAVPAKAGPALSTPARGGIYLGTFNRAVAGPPENPVNLRRYPGVKFRILHRFQAWWGDDRFLGEKWLDAVADSGAVPMVSWEPWRKPEHSVAAPNQRRGILRQIANGRHDLYVRRWARDARAYGKPLLLRFMHEMNGNWYPWSVNINGNTPAAFRAAWRHVHDIFRREGARNVGWVLSVESFAGGKPTPRKELNHLYPGRNYVDWVGLSGFNWSQRPTRVLSYERVFRRSYEVVKGFGKPIILAETGTATADPRTAPTWVRDALRSTPTRFPRVKALVWYDSAHPARDFTLRGSALARLRVDGRRPMLRPPLRLRLRP